MGDAFIAFVHIFSQKYVRSMFSKKGFFIILTAVLLLSVFAALTLASFDTSIAVTEPDGVSICENATGKTLSIESIYGVEISSMGLRIIKHLAGVIDECGDNASFLIEVKNVGETYAYDMNITELIPSGLQYVAGSSTVTGATPSSTNFTGNPLVWEFNQSDGWAPGTDVTITFNVTVAGPCDFTGGNAVAVVNYMTPCRDFGIEAENGVKANDANPHLSTTKTPSLTIAESDNAVNRTIMVQSDGDYEAKNVTLTDVLPGNTGYGWSDPVRNGGTGTSGDLARNLTHVTGCTADLAENNTTVFRSCCTPKKKSTTITELRTSPAIKLSNDRDYIDACGGNYMMRIKNTGSNASVVGIIDVLPEGFGYRDNSSTITSSNGRRKPMGAGTYTFGPRGPDIAYDIGGVNVTSEVNQSDGDCANGSMIEWCYWVNGTWNTGLPAGAKVINANFSCRWKLQPKVSSVVNTAHMGDTLYFEYWNGTGWEEIGNKSEEPSSYVVDWVDATSFLSDCYQNPELRCFYMGAPVQFDYLSLELEIEDTQNSPTIQKTPDYQREATIGESVNFTIFVDLPNATLYNVTVNDTLPAGFIYNSSSFEMVANNDSFDENVSDPNDGTASVYVNWTLGTVNNSDNSDITINFNVTIADVLHNQIGTVLNNSVIFNWVDHTGAEGNVSDESGNITILEPDLQINKIANASVVEAGDYVNYTITVNHTDASTWGAYDVWINDTVPDGLNILSSESNPQANRTMQSGNNISWFYYKMVGGMTLVFNYTVIVNDTVVAGQNLTNNATLTWTSTNGTNINERYYNGGNSSQVSVKNASIDLTKTVWNGTAWVDSCNKDIGDNATFNITIQNTGTDPLINITVNDTLPSGLSNASWINNTRTWEFDKLSTGGTIHIEFNTTVNSSMVLVNQANVTARSENTSMPVFDEDNATVLAEADLSIKQSDSPDPVIAGKYLKYEINVTNNGPGYARNVTVTDVLPGEVVFSSASPSPNGSAERVYWWNFTGIEANSSIIIGIYVVTGATGSLKNTVNVTSATHDPNETNNEDTEYTTVRGEDEGGGGGGSNSHTDSDDSAPDDAITPDKQEQIDNTDPNNPDTGDGTRLHPPPGTNDRLIPDPVSLGLVIPFIAFIFFITPLILSRVDVVDNGELNPAEISMLRSTVCVPEGVKIGKILPCGIVRVKADRGLYTCLCETYDIPTPSAKAIAIALGKGGLTRVILQDEKAYDLAIKMGLNAFKRS